MTATGGDPVFKIRTSREVCCVCLFELLHQISMGHSLDLVSLRPHQRAPVVTALAVMMSALIKYAQTAPSSAQMWSDEWTRQVGTDALRLIAPTDEVAFFQPPFTAHDSVSAMDLSAVDCVFFRQEPVRSLAKQPKHKRVLPQTS